MDRLRATTHFDESFISLLLHSLEFEYPATPQAVNDPKPLPSKDPKYDGKWYCVNGGTSILAGRLKSKLDQDAKSGKTNFEFKTDSRVTKIAYRSNNPDRPMVVSVAGKKAEEYSHVITTTTGACLQLMDLREAGLDYSQREAIRVLRYDNSVKVGIKFKTRWWAEKNRIIRGGLGHTDRPTRVVVYPSYALDTPTGQTGVLLACYNWAQDAARLGNLSSGSDPEKQEAIYRVVIADLAIMHNIPEETLIKDTVKYHVHDWYRDEFTGGAFGMFGPGQFSSLFGRIQRPASKGHLFMAGEITSIYHGWIVASLNSAIRAIDQMLMAKYLGLPKSDAQGKLYCVYLRYQLEQRWGLGSDHEPAPDTTWQKELFNEKGLGGWQVYLGMFMSEQELKSPVPMDLS